MKKLLLLLFLSLSLISKSQTHFGDSPNYSKIDLHIDYERDINKSNYYPSVVDNI